MHGKIQPAREMQLAIYYIEYTYSIDILTHHVRLWTISTMTSKNKNGGDSGGTLYREPMEGLAFHYD